jgi:hypothetical protein
MNLKLQLLANNDEKTWTLKSTRNYSIGNTPDCDIKLTGLSVDVNLKFSYDQYSNLWYVSDVSKRGNLLINNQSLSDYQIQSRSTIVLEKNTTINIVPENSQSSPNNSYPQSGISPVSNNSKNLRKLSWLEYVDECVTVQRANRFSLITGYRFAAWVKAANSVGFNSFDGYIIPDIQNIPGCERSSEVVVSAIQSKLGEMIESTENKKYSNTDCYIASLTDAHITDSLTQSFLWSFFWVEFFPIKRGIKNKTSDYRDFCVVSYNRVKTYLLIENYGADLFVSWITRYEPTPTALVQIICGVIAVLLSLIAAASNNVFLTISPVLLWGAIYFAIPRIMMTFGILPKKANANFLGVCIFILTLILLVIFVQGSSRSGSPFELLALFGILAGGGTILVPVFVIMFIIAIFNPKNIPALDLVDAKKLDDAVSKQVESVLKPMLEKSNYTAEQISQILTKTSLGRIQFRR